MLFGEFHVDLVNSLVGLLLFLVFYSCWILLLVLFQVTESSICCSFGNSCWDWDVSIWISFGKHLECFTLLILMHVIEPTKPLLRLETPIVVGWPLFI